MNTEEIIKNADEIKTTGKYEYSRSRNGWVRVGVGDLCRHIKTKDTRTLISVSFPGVACRSQPTIQVDYVCQSCLEDYKYLHSCDDGGAVWELDPIPVSGINVLE